MKRIIDGKTYNTDTSTLIAQVEGKWQDPTDGIEYDSLDLLYQNRGGAFFVHEHLEWGSYDQEDGEWRTKKTDTFTPKTHEEAAAWLHETNNVEIFNDLLGEPPEATAEQEKGATIYIRVPASLKARVDRAALDQKLSGNAWAIRCVEQCLEDRDLHGLPGLAYIWEIASTFRAHDDGEWSREKCIEALSEISGYAEDLAKDLFGSDDFAKLGYDIKFDWTAEDLHKKYQPYS